jgi:thioredoxin-like negative regulator of GroEL
MRYSALFIFQFFFLSVSVLFAQRSPIVFQSDERVSAQLNSYSVPYGTSEAKVFQLISPSNRAGQTINSIRYTFREIKKIEREGRELRFSVVISQFSLEGNYDYRGFNISDFLKPVSFTATAEWKDPRGVKVLRSFNIKSSLKQNNNPVWDLVVADSNFNASYKLFVRDYQFYFDASGVRELEQFCKITDNYYDDAQKLQSALNRLNVSQMLDIEKIDENEASINQLKRELSAYKSANYNSVLNLSVSDPLAFNANLTNFENKLKQLEQKNVELKQKLPELYYDKGLGELRRGNTYSAQQYFERAIKENREFAAPKVELARIFIKSGNRNDAIALCAEVEKSYGVDYRVKADNNIVVKEIYDSYLVSIRNEIAYKKYETALRLIDETAAFCRNFYALSCGYDLDNLKKQAAQQMYSDAATRCRLAISQHNILIAEKNLMEMEQMLSFYQGMLSASEVNNLWTMLYQTHIADARDFNYKTNFESALNSLKEAEKICSNKNPANCSAEIQSIKNESNKGLYAKNLQQIESLIYSNNIRSAETLLDQTISLRKQNLLTESPLEAKFDLQIKQKNYDNAINEMNFGEQNKQYALAIQWAERALSLESNPLILKKGNVVKSIENLAILWASAELEKANQYIAQNEISLARKKLNETETILNNYNVPVDKQVYSSLNSAKNNIYSAQCRGFEEQYQSIIDQAISLMDKKKFIEADKKFDEAISYAKLKKECAIDYADAETYKEEIKAPKVYQEKLIEIENLSNYNLYDEAIIKYVDLENYFYQFKINAFGIVYLSVYDYALKQSDRFIMHSIKYAMQKNEPDKGFDLLKVLKGRGTRKSNTKTSQILLGIELANRDFKENRLNDPKKKVLVYTFADKWYGYFEKAYVQQWKKLK